MEKSGKRKILVDGFPRNEDNVRGWTENMSDKADIRGVLYFDVPEDVMVGRVLERAKIGGPGARADDTEEVVRKRLKTNASECEPIVRMYEGKGMVQKLDGSKPVEDGGPRVREGNALVIASVAIVFAPRHTLPPG